MLRPLSLLSAVLALSSTGAAAQVIITDPPTPGNIETAFTGVVEALPILHDEAALSICAPPEFALEHSGGTFFLTSSTINLADYIGQNVKLYATNFIECPLWDVTAVEVPPPATLALCGTGGFGCPIRLRSGPGGLAQHWLFVSPSPGLVPLNPVKGSFLLGQPNLLIAMQSTTPFSIGAAFDFSIPVIPALVDQPLYFQAARRAASVEPQDGLLAPIQFGNVVRLDVVGFTLLCWEPDC